MGSLCTSEVTLSVSTVPIELQSENNPTDIIMTSSPDNIKENLIPPMKPPRQDSKIKLSSKPSVEDDTVKVETEETQNSHEKSISDMESNNLSSELSTEPIILPSTSAIVKPNNCKTVLHDVIISLVPHEHTLFCERKERVCTAMGKIQELESLTVTGHESKIKSGHVETYWLRSTKEYTHNMDQPMDHERFQSGFIRILSSQGKATYRLEQEDVGHYIGYEITIGNTNNSDNNGSNNNDSNQEEGDDSHHTHIHHTHTQDEVFYSSTIMGPVLPGPPRMLDLQINGTMKSNEKAIAVGRYIGGNEGPSEYWWMRIRDGERENINQPKSIHVASETIQSELETMIEMDDPRVYMIKPEDVGCVLKVKCRPIRNDGTRGEIFTSKASDIIELPAESV